MLDTLPKLGLGRRAGLSGGAGLCLIAGRPILPRVAVLAELEAAIERLYGRNRTSPRRGR